MSKTSRLLLAALAASVLSGAAFAQSEAEMAEYKRNCTGDYMRFCSAYDPASPQVQACFKANLRNLSARCQATISQARGGRR